MMRTASRLALGFAVALLASATAHAVVVDLATSTDGNTPDTLSGNIGQGLFVWTDAQPTGTGFIDSFVQVQAQGNATTELGYNTTVNNVFDNGSTDQFNHELLVSDVPIVNIDGVDYRQFLLDINESLGQDGEFISLDDVQLFLSNTPNQSVETFTGGVLDLQDATLIYQFGADDRVELNAALNSGSGSGDMFMYIPDSLFVGGLQFVYLHSSFGDPNGVDAGFEEWAVVRRDGDVIPEPASLSLLGLGLAVMSVQQIRRRRRA